MDDEYIAQLAQEWKDGLKFLEKDVVLYTEDIADAKFWSHIFETFNSHLKVDFRYYTHSPDGVFHTGKGMAKRYLPYLDNKLMLCLDSDYDYIISTPDFDVQHYIFQTYTYSIENYKCCATSLAELCKRATQHNDEIPFDIHSFVTRYSEIIYPLFIYSIADKINSIGFPISDFSALIQLPNNFNHEDSERELVTLHERVTAKIAELTVLCPSQAHEQAESIIASKCITPTNAYFFIRGHSLYDNVVIRLIKSIVDGIQNQKIKTLKDTGKAKEIEPYLATCPKVEKLLNNNFNFFDCEVFTKIKNDINYIA